MWALNSNSLLKKYCNLWRNIGGLHDGTPERSGHPNLSGPYQKINFITTNCCQYRVIWCKCSPVINEVFNIACYKGFTTVIIILLSLSWQEFACDNVWFITYMRKNRIYFCLAIMLYLSRLLKFCLESWDSYFPRGRPHWFLPLRCDKKVPRDIFALCYISLESLSGILWVVWRPN